MKKQKIFYIDDLSFALPQLINAVPRYVDYELIYVQRICDIVVDDFDLVILDFYLDKDNKTSLEIVGLFAGMPILSFSTAVSKNMYMLDNGAQFQVQKLKNTHTNKELKKVLQNIFPRN